MVEATGFEPAASASRTQRSTKLSHASTYNNSCQIIILKLVVFVKSFTKYLILVYQNYFGKNKTKGSDYLDKKKYSKMVDKVSPPSKAGVNFVIAYIVGGTICVIGQLFRELNINLGFDEVLTGMSVSTTLIFIAALLTGLRIFEKIAKHAGAGTLVPITGFANSVVSPAIEFKNEGWILGVGAKMFVIAGPVIVYGTVASFIYGIICWITQLL